MVGTNSDHLWLSVLGGFIAAMLVFLAEYLHQRRIYRIRWLVFGGDGRVAGGFERFRWFDQSQLGF